MMCFEEVIEYVDEFVFSGELEDKKVKHHI